MTDQEKQKDLQEKIKKAKEKQKAILDKLTDTADSEVEEPTGVILGSENVIKNLDKYLKESKDQDDS